MNDLQLLLSVTISEFEVFRDLGALRVDPARIVVTRLSKNTGYGSEVDAQLLAKLPEFLPGEDHAVLILAFQGLPASEPPEDPMSALLSGRVTLSARHCSQVIPLTRRAREILTGRLNGQVVLDEPLFEDLIESHLARVEKQSSRSGAESLVEALLENHEEFRHDRLHDAMNDSNHPLRRLLDSIIRFTRHKSMPREPISGLRDLGGLLKESAVEERELPLKQLGEWLRPKQDELRGFRKVYSDSGLTGILGRITRAWDLPASAAGFAIFLHWRDLALRVGGVDLDAVASDCQELAGGLDGQAVVEALWLLGFSSGFEAVAPGCYRRMGDKHPFNPTGRSGKRVTLLSLPPFTSPEPAVTCSPEPQPPSAEIRNQDAEEKKPAPEPVQVSAEDFAKATDNPDKDGESDVGSDTALGPAEPESTATSSPFLPAEETDQMSAPEPTPPPSPDGTSVESEPSTVKLELAKKKPAKRKKTSKKPQEEPLTESGAGELFTDNP